MLQTTSLHTSLGLAVAVLPGPHLLLRASRHSAVFKGLGDGVRELGWSLG